MYPTLSSIVPITAGMDRGSTQLGGCVMSVDVEMIGWARSVDMRCARGSVKEREPASGQQVRDGPVAQLDLSNKVVSKTPKISKTANHS